MILAFLLGFAAGWLAYWAYKKFLDVDIVPPGDTTPGGTEPNDDNRDPTGST